MITLLFIVPIILFIHELGHVFFVKVCKCHIAQITFGIGKTILKIHKVKIKALYFLFGCVEWSDINASRQKEVLIYSGGFIFNLMSCILVEVLNKNLIADIFYRYAFYSISMEMIIISILPINFPIISRNTDGNKIFNLIKN